MFAFAKSSNQHKVEHLCSLEILECMIEEKVEGNDVLVCPVFNDG